MVVVVLVEWRGDRNGGNYPTRINVHHKDIRKHTMIQVARIRGHLQHLAMSHRLCTASFLADSMTQKKSTRRQISNQSCKLHVEISRYIRLLQAHRLR